MGMKHKVAKHAKRMAPKAAGKYPTKAVTGAHPSDSPVSDEDQALLAELSTLINEGPDAGMVLSPLAPGQGCDDDEVLGDIGVASQLESTEYVPEED